MFVMLGTDHTTAWLSSVHDTSSFELGENVTEKIGSASPDPSA